MSLIGTNVDAPGRCAAPPADPLATSLAECRPHLHELLQRLEKTAAGSGGTAAVALHAAAGLAAVLLETTAALASLAGPPAHSDPDAYGTAAPVALPDLIAQTCAEQQPLAAIRGVTLDATIADTADGDWRWLRPALTLLIQQAMQLVPPGRGRVIVQGGRAGIAIAMVPAPRGGPGDSVGLLDLVRHLLREADVSLAADLERGLLHVRCGPRRR